MLIVSRKKIFTSAIVLCATGIGIAGVTDQTVRPQDTTDAVPVAKTTVSTSGIKQMVFEEQKIEGKIRRPQLVLIKADQRPEFNPMEKRRRTG